MKFIFYLTIALLLICAGTAYATTTLRQMTLFDATIRGNVGAVATENVIFGAENVTFGGEQVVH